MTEDQAKSKTRAAIALGITALLLAAAGIALYQFVWKVEGTRDPRVMRSDLLAVRRLLREQMDCRETVRGTACDGTFFPIKSKEGQVLGKYEHRAWRIGDWYVRGSCDGISLRIETARLASDTSFVPDPTRPGAVYDWRPLFAGKALMCEGQVPKAIISCPNPPCRFSSDHYTVRIGALSPVKGTNGCNYDKNSVHFYGEVECPPGSIAVGGSANCQIPPWGGLMLTNQVMQDKGTGRPSGWKADCCGSEKAPVYENGLAVICAWTN